MKIDLHLHTTASDGVLNPVDLVKFAKLTGHSIISITDHDTVNGIDQALYEGEFLDIDVIPGLELSAYKEKEYHILAYYIDWRDDELIEKLEDIRYYRKKRMIEIINSLNSIYDIKIDYDEFKERFKESNYGRLQLAGLMYEKGIIKNAQDAFKLYLYDNGPCDPPKYPISVEHAISLIHRKGGVAILSHPGIYFANNIEALEDFLKIGFDGIEVFHPMHGELTERTYYDMAVANNLVITGGSDYHGYFNEEIFPFDLHLKIDDVQKILKRVKTPIIYI